MKKFFIEVPHGESKKECQQAIRVFVESGSHYLSNAEWGCMDGEHKSWIIMEAPSKEEVRNVVPPLYRHEAKIVELTTFSRKTVDMFHDDL